MGMVVLGCTTPCVAVSSRKSSDLLTVISIVVVPAAVAIASTGIDRVSQAEGSFDPPLILKEKPAKPARHTLDRAISASRRRPAATPLVPELRLDPVTQGRERLIHLAVRSAC